MRRVVVTGLGAVTPLGAGIRQTWRRLLDSGSGIVSTSSRGAQFEKLPSRVAGLVPQGSRDDGRWQAKDWMLATAERQMALFAQYAIASTQEALEDAGWHPTAQHDLEATGVTLGSGIGNLDEAYNTSIAFHEGGYRKVSPLFVPRLLINLAAGHVSIRYGFKGPNHAATTACTTGVHAIGDASRLIAFGDADVMVAGGAESCIHPLAIAGFARARSLATAWNDAPSASSRPFDKDRAGFVIGEGAGIMVLEELEHAKARKANIYAEVRGYGLSSDAYHMTAPREDGEGAYLAMRQALRHASAKPEAVDYVNAHATSTILGDAAENTAIKRLLLGADGKKHASEINVSGTKGAIGHLLGAAGAVEAIFTTLAIRDNVLPPTLNLDNLPEGFDCNYVPKVPQHQPVNLALTNSFGFGGTNASLCLAAYPCAIVLSYHITLVSTAVLAWTLGLRHALDADHISAIDLMTRRLIASGQRPVTVGTYFSLGHSTIVIITSIVVAATSAAISDRFGPFSNIGGIIGSSVSAAFLILLGIINGWILYKLVQQLRTAIASPIGHELLDFNFEGGGCMTLVLKKMFKLIDKPWKMYPLGVLFGLGFDTSSEIALLGISSIQAAQGTSIWLILIFPLLFTAGMCLLDTFDGAAMMSLYTSAGLARDVIAILYYQCVLTAVTVAVALVVGFLQLFGLILSLKPSLSGPFWHGIEVAGDHYDIIGGSICGSFLIFGLLSIVLYKPWRRLIERGRAGARVTLGDDDEAGNQEGITTVPRSEREEAGVLTTAGKDGASHTVSESVREG
ncbi:Mitochondrial beta-keto-acyl synthase [Elasticomyces elasticus]|nr:Mitochondrial beta-keto-acyl synthase [Elasticomyces elasticus]KAK3638594.1 Mitochondrial beta-keto-acyl synthase [Elasticomyces elasticus]KAK4913026.1 Mitochondrial beta-keto-acyl synthase [Elasticomyces elasticus]KAK5757586.1 Mitochondrial beta-keto-acyl synthase [Elasticomyces elasticus]